MLLLSVLVALCLVGVVPTVSKSVRSHSVMDIRFLPWPAARYPLELPLHNVDCFSEMDRRHIVPAVITYRLENTKRFRNGVCLVRIPTRSRVTVVRMSTNNAKSYVEFIAGSTQLHMPLRTVHIHADQEEKYGPWHVPCRHAYMVFRSRSDQHEWVEFQLEPEVELDAADDQRDDCAKDGHNYAESVLMHRTA
ncbi:hypothetical protein GPALN_014576 [Globodera pallida]|nr:hypothetical protein GPALN_014576 [Globodera pallida]